VSRDAREYLIIFAVTCILAYLLAVILYPSVSAITAAPTPTVDIFNALR